MSLDIFRACVQGYSDRLFDQQVQSVQSGYWAAYYSNTKHPKPPKNLISEMVQQKLKSEKRRGSKIVRPEVDVDAFLAAEEQFFRRLQSK